MRRTALLDLRGDALLPFRSPTRLLAHLRDHVLTAPEHGAWARIVQELVASDSPSGATSGGATPEVYATIVGAHTFEARQAFSRAMFQDLQRAQPLGDLYLEAAARALRFAAIHDWHGAAQGQRCALGSSGVVVFWAQDTLLTVYCPIYHMAKTPADHDTPELRREALAGPRAHVVHQSASRAVDPARQLYDDVFMPSWDAVSGWRFDRPHGRPPQGHDAVRAALAKTLSDKWATRRPSWTWWRSAHHQACAQETTP